MRELLRNAWMGWQDYISDGKLAAVLLLLLLMYWFGSKGKKQIGEPANQLYRYTTLMVVLCICPVTAVCFMIYQTRFYDYQWIWSLVPVTVVIGYGGTVFLTKYWAEWKENKKQRGNTAAITLLGLSILLLCSSLGSEEGLLAETDSLEDTRQLLELLGEQDAEEICLWAPQEIMENARLVDGSIRLVYGRNIWDKSLDGYSYDQYTEEVEALYEWMCLAEQDVLVEEEGYQQAAVRAQTAIAAGVNCIVLPGHLETAALALMENTLGVSGERTEDYYIIHLEP